jgi:hypothetical protein
MHDHALGKPKQIRPPQRFSQLGLTHKDQLKDEIFTGIDSPQSPSLSESGFVQILRLIDNQDNAAVALSHVLRWFPGQAIPKEPIQAGRPDVCVYRSTNRPSNPRRVE